jgi:hypothetical protein
MSQPLDSQDWSAEFFHGRPYWREPGRRSSWYPWQDAAQEEQ